MPKDDRKVLLRVRNLSKYFPLKKKSIFSQERRYVRANESISLDIYAGETLGLVGESGCGKSTLGRTLLQLYPLSSGYVTYGGKSIYTFRPAYAEKILSHFAEEVAAWKKLYAQTEKAREAFLALSPEEQVKARPGYAQKIYAERAQYYVLTELAGGLIYAEDTAAAGEALYKAYLAGIEAHKEGSTPEEQAAFAAAQAKVEALWEQCRNAEGFAEAEENREEGLDLMHLEKEEMRSLRRDLQIIFQDPYSSLDARMTIGQSIGEGLLTHHFFEKNGEDMQAYIMQVMEECGLQSYFFHRYPHQFSGGQRQRVGIARALALKPRFVVCDEAVSALDVSIQSQIINLLRELKEKEDLTYLFISHNLSVVRYISDRIAVMYLGDVVELSETEMLFAHPMHPYTAALLNAIPAAEADSEGEEKILEGDIPSPVSPPSGCKFHTRCEYCTEICKKEAPVAVEVEPGHFVACHHAL